MGDSFTTAAGAEAGGIAEAEAAGADGQRSWAAASRRRRQAAAVECRSAGLLGSKPRTVTMKESSLSADGRAWPSKTQGSEPGGFQAGLDLRRGRPLLQQGQQGRRVIKAMRHDNLRLTSEAWLQKYS